MLTRIAWYLVGIGHTMVAAFGLFVHFRSVVAEDMYTGFGALDFFLGLALFAASLAIPLLYPRIGRQALRRVVGIIVLMVGTILLLSIVVSFLGPSTSMDGLLDFVLLIFVMPIGIGLTNLGWNILKCEIG